jgi:hypothetical protein
MTELGAHKPSAGGFPRNAGTSKKRARRVFPAAPGLTTTGMNQCLDKLVKRKVLSGSYPRRDWRDHIMKPFGCAGCGKLLTMGIWDKFAQRLYCRDCIRQLPSPEQRSASHLSLEALSKASKDSSGRPRS